MSAECPAEPAQPPKQNSAHSASLCSVGFAPWDDHLLVYSEESKNVHLRRVPRESDAAAGSSGASGSRGSGPVDGGEGQQQAAAPPAAALFEQNAEDGELVLASRDLMDGTQDVGVRCWAVPMHAVVRVAWFC